MLKDDSGGSPAFTVYYDIPWEPITFIFRGYSPYFGVESPGFSWFLGSKGMIYSYFLIYTVFLCAFKSKSTPTVSGPYIELFQQRT